VPIVAVFQPPNFTREKYEESVVKVTGGKRRVESPADWPVEGLLAHIAGEGESGFRVVDVWASEDAFNRFGETLLPILADLGIEVSRTSTPHTRSSRHSSGRSRCQAPKVPGTIRESGGGGI
jgi:hypothetical protein